MDMVTDTNGVKTRRYGQEAREGENNPGKTSTLNGEIFAMFLLGRGSSKIRVDDPEQLFVCLQLQADP